MLRFREQRGMESHRGVNEKIGGWRMIYGIFGLTVLLMGTLEQFLINESRIVACISMIMLVTECGVILRSEIKKKPGIEWLLGLLAVIQSAGLISDRWIVYTGLGVIMNVAGAILCVMGCVKVVQGSGKRAVPLMIAFGVVLIPTLVVLFTTFFPKTSMGIVKKAAFPNPNVTEAAYSETTLENDARLVSNLCYDREYPNGDLDIYYTAKPREAKPATLIYIHGGGYIWGDKASGDPNAGELDMKDSFIYSALEAGYHVVSMNYCLAPEYVYPTSIIQLNNGLKYLREHAEEYGINMEKIFLVGGSAGGNLIGVMANLQTNPEYAAEMNIKPALEKDTIKGVLFESALLDNSQYGVTHNVTIDYLFYQLGRVYLQTNDLKYDREKVTLSNVIDNVCKDFPPSLISDGNSGTFFDQAFAMNAKLTELGVETKFIYYPESVAVLGHGYEELGSDYSRITQQRMIEFMERYE